MILSIVSIVLSALFFVVLNLELYTDRMPLPDGSYRNWHMTPLERLEAADNRFLFYLQILFAAVSVISAILFMVGLKNNVVKMIRLISLIASAVMFVILMLVSGNTFAKY